jgi:hypothetical protein
VSLPLKTCHYHNADLKIQTFAALKHRSQRHGGRPANYYTNKGQRSLITGKNRDELKITTLMRRTWPQTERGGCAVQSPGLVHVADVAEAGRQARVAGL